MSGPVQIDEAVGDPSGSEQADVQANVQAGEGRTGGSGDPVSGAGGSGAEVAGEDSGVEVDVEHPEFLNVDPLKANYHEAFIDSPALRRSLERADTALLCIDMQYLDAVRGYGVFANAEASGVPLEAQEYYFDRLEQIVLPNVRRLQDAFRSTGLEVIHTRIQSLTRDGRDRSPGHKRLGLHAAPGSKEAQFVELVAPEPDEIVIEKTASGVFNSTNLGYVLRNLGVNGLFVTGVYSNECVSTAIRDACDLGFYVTLIEDGCATVTPELQRATITTMKDRYARVLSTAQAIAEVEQVVGASDG